MSSDGWTPKSKQNIARATQQQLFPVTDIKNEERNFDEREWRPFTNINSG